jgi:hypothetical protein
MKRNDKQTQKLPLAATTVRVLEATALSHVVGGVLNVFMTTRSNGCQ